MRGQFQPGLWLVFFEFNAVKAKQALRRTNPQVPIFSLGKRADFARRAIVHAPGRVVELQDISISVERERREATERDEKRDPKGQRKLPGRIERFPRIHNREEPRGT